LAKLRPGGRALGLRQDGGPRASRHLPDRGLAATARGLVQETKDRPRLLRRG